MSIPGVEGCLDAFKSVAGGVPFPPPELGPPGGLTDGGEGSDRYFVVRTCCDKGLEVIPALVEADGPRREFFCGECAVEGADEAVDAAAFPGVELPDCEAESCGERRELISILLKRLRPRGKGEYS